MDGWMALGVQLADLVKQTRVIGTESRKFGTESTDSSYTNGRGFPHLCSGKTEVGNRGICVGGGAADLVRVRYQILIL